MNTRLNVLVTTSAALLLGLTWTGSTMAQESSLDMPDPETDRASCEEIDWNRDLVLDYPWVADACQEAIVVDGQPWARFEAEFQEYNRSDGTFTVDFPNDNGRSLGIVTLKPGPDQRVQLDNRSIQFSEVRRGQLLNFYVPEGMYGFSTEPGVSDNEMANVVESDDEQSSQMAQADSDRNRNTDRNTDRNRQQDTLPATAGPLPIIALGGLLSLLGGATLTTRRRRKTPNA